jgi:hypothetical protein
MLGTVALGQELSATHDRLATAPATRPLLMRKEGMAAIEGEITKAGCLGAVCGDGSRQGTVGGQGLGVLCDGSIGQSPIHPARRLWAWRQGHGAPADLALLPRLLPTAVMLYARRAQAWR